MRILKKPALASGLRGRSRSWRFDDEKIDASPHFPFSFSLGVRKGISPVKILYGMTLLCMVISF